MARVQVFVGIRKVDSTQIFATEELLRPSLPNSFLVSRLGSFLQAHRSESIIEARLFLQCFGKVFPWKLLQTSCLLSLVFGGQSVTSNLSDLHSDIVVGQFLVTKNHAYKDQGIRWNPGIQEHGTRGIFATFPRSVVEV